MMATMDALTDRSRGTSLAELGFADAGLDAGPPHPGPPHPHALLPTPTAGS